MFCQLSGQPLAQLCWHIQLTIKMAHIHLIFTRLLPSDTHNSSLFFGTLPCKLQSLLPQYNEHALHFSELWKENAPRQRELGMWSSPLGFFSPVPLFYIACGSVLKNCCLIYRHTSFYCTSQILNFFFFFFFFFTNWRFVATLCYQMMVSIF